MCINLNIKDIIFFCFCKFNYTLIIIGIVLIWKTFMLGSGRNRQPFENTINMSEYRQQQGHDTFIHRKFI